MADLKFTIILFLFLIKYSTCRRDHDMYIKLEIINNLSKQMYGDVKGKSWQPHGVQDLDDLVYPRGDKHKLSLLSSLWRDYYSCTVRLLFTLTRHRTLPSVMLMVYAGAVARVPCSICVAPGESGAVMWMYTKNTTNSTFIRLHEHERMVREYSNLAIYNVKTEDAGVYQCQVGDTHMVAILEVVDTEDNYTVVKPPTSKGPYPSPAHTLPNGLTLFSAWSPWSECSVCGRVGRRRRYGPCYIKLDRRVKSRHSRKRDDSKGNFTMLSDKEMRLFEAFPGGVPCRSRYLPSSLRLLPDIQMRSNEIMIGMCKTPCKLEIFQSLSKVDNTLETANNTAGVFSLQQQLPKQPPVAVRDTVFADFGDRIVLQCPGTTLRDAPLLWRAGTQVISPRELTQASAGRVYVNSRDHLVFTRALYKDADLYSCWQRDNLAGTVKLIVWSGAFCVSNHHALLLALVGAAAGLMCFVGQRGMGV